MDTKTTVAVAMIDDSPSDVELLRCYVEDLRDPAVNLVGYGSFEAGLAGVLQDPPDLILVDYYLGARSGLDLCGELREEGVRAPIILLTGRGDENIAIEAIRAGVADYLSKDAATPQALARSFMHVLKKHELEERVEEHRRELERTVDGLRRRNEEIQSFYHTLSHEMNTPLASAREFLSIVLDGIGGPLSGDQTRFLGIARESCDRIALYITDLLDAARLETGKLNVERRWHDLGEVVTRVISVLGPKARLRGVELRSEIAPGLKWVFMDDARIIQVLTNLLKNGIRFTPEGGEVKVAAVAAGPEDDRVEVSVIDTGEGIPPEAMTRIFDRLYQVNRLEHGSGGGLGIGLFLAQEMIRLHGSEIRVSSRVGHGSSFSFSLPAASEKGGPSESTTPTGAAHVEDSRC